MARSSEINRIKPVQRPSEPRDRTEVSVEVFRHSDHRVSVVTQREPVELVRTETKIRSEIDYKISQQPSSSAVEPLDP